MNIFSNFCIGYLKYGFDEFNINTFNILTPLALLNSSWGSWVNALENIFGIYNIKISEIVAANGNDNLDVTKYPSRVSTAGYTTNPYEYEGGMFFGRGTWHDSGKNIMNSNYLRRGPDDGFAYAHSGSQKEVVNEALVDTSKALRPNDRVRNAGPLRSWVFSWGPTVRALMFDSDKGHVFHPTKSYDVQVSWDERTWKVCRWGFVPYPCYTSERRTVQKNITPEVRYLDLKTSKLYSLASFVQGVLCSVGVTQLGSGYGAVDLCGLSVEEMSNSLLPAIKFVMPYQEVSIPTDQWMTTYQWRFRTNNATFTSGWTGWASFLRVF